MKGPGDVEALGVVHGLAPLPRPPFGLLAALLMLHALEDAEQPHPVLAKLGESLVCTFGFVIIEPNLVLLLWRPVACEPKRTDPDGPLFGRQPLVPVDVARPVPGVRRVLETPSLVKRFLDGTEPLLLIGLLPEGLGLAVIVALAIRARVRALSPRCAFGKHLLLVAIAALDHDIGEHVPR